MKVNIIVYVLKHFYILMGKVILFYKRGVGVTNLFLSPCWDSGLLEVRIRMAEIRGQMRMT